MERTILKDPLGNRVSFELSSCFPGPKGSGHLRPSDLEAAITHPAMIIAVEQEAARYYYRSMDWNLTLLVRVRLQDEVWTSETGSWNPSSAELTSLVKKGRQLL